MPYGPKYKILCSPRNTRLNGVLESERIGFRGRYMTENQDGVQIIVRKAFGPEGHNLVGISDVTFDGFPAVTLEVHTPDGRKGLVHLSPIHGDARKVGFVEIEAGTRCTLYCPKSGKALERVQDIEGAYDAGYYALYRTADLSHGSMIMISDVWGHYHSRVVDDFEIISAWTELDGQLNSE